MTDTVQPKPQKRRLKIEPEAGGQLEQFLIAYHQAKDEADMAGERADELKQSIKGWLLSLGVQADGFDIVADPTGRYPGYAMTLKGGKRLNTAEFRKDYGTLYMQYEVDIKPSWELREASQGRHR